MWIIIDTEYTAWEGSQERNWSRKNEYRELVQIGYLIFDNNYIIKKTGSIYFKPRYNPKLSKYFVNLTKINQKQIDKKGLDFNSGIRKFWSIIDNNTILSFGDDIKIIKENYKIYQEDYPKVKKKFINIRNVLNKTNINIENKTSGNLYKLTDYKIVEPNIHNAEWDVYSIFLFIKHFDLINLINDYLNLKNPIHQKL